MPLPIAKYGLREIFLFGVPLLILSGLLLAWIWPLSFLPMAAFLFVLAFFRDPERAPPSEPEAILAPADGKVVEIAEAEESLFLEGKAVKIGIFMSLFNVHVNRAPVKGEVLFVKHRDGKFLNAFNPKASQENESCIIGIQEPDGSRVTVKQIAGVIARRIVCAVGKGAALEKGQRFGMIKFGSRVEVFLPLHKAFACRVNLNQQVKAGVSVLGVWKENQS